MKKWKLKALLQGTIAILPGARFLNGLFQKTFSNRLIFKEKNLLSKYVQCELHLEHFRKLRGPDLREVVALELGTGWFPVVPVGLWLNGVREVYTFDLDSLLSKKRVLKVLTIYSSLIAQKKIVTTREKEQVLNHAIATSSTHSVSEILECVGVHVRVADCRRSGLTAQSVDLFVSNNTFEHIPSEILHGILKEFRRLSKPNGVMSHYIDMGDHYASFDKSITLYNYLRYSDREWARFNNSLHYQNRLRNSDFLRLHETASWRVTEQNPVRAAHEKFDSVPLAPEFQKYDKSDLMIYGNWMISTPHP